MPIVNLDTRKKLVADMSNRLKGGSVALLDQDRNQLASFGISIKVSDDGLSFSASTPEPLILGESVKTIAWNSSEGKVVLEESAMNPGKLETPIFGDWDAYAAEHQEEWDRGDAEWYQEHYGED